MAETELSDPAADEANTVPCEKPALAAGLFGYSIGDGQIRSFKATEGYLRDMEQMPNFSPPPVRTFVAQYIASHIGKADHMH